MKAWLWIVTWGLLASSAVLAKQCDVELMVLGTAQDAGAPQLGNNSDPAWHTPALRRLATSLAIIDHSNKQRFLFEATPDLREQLYRLDEYKSFSTTKPDLSGIFLTHAHIGHYVGLMFLGHESMGAHSVPVYAMPRMAHYLSSNGPWDQLVKFKNIELRELANRKTTKLNDKLAVEPYQVPHRDEYSETVGFLIKTQRKSALFIPDIDSWDLWKEQFGLNIEAMIQQVDYAFLDATFYDDNEIPGRDMSQFPHPRIAKMMQRFQHLSSKEKNKIYFIHLNHTNPARFPDSPQARKISALGFQHRRKRPKKLSYVKT